MSWFPKPSNPKAAFEDLRAFMRQRDREQVIGFALAILVTTIIVIEFVVDAQMGTAPPPQIVYAESWSANRSDAEIIADQKKDQAARAEALKQRQEEFKKLEKKLGM